MVDCYRDRRWDPASLGWLDPVHDLRTRSLGVKHFGQSGTINDLYRHFGIDANSISTAADRLASGRPVKALRAVE